VTSPPPSRQPPPGPYLHGSRYIYDAGDALLTDIVNGSPDPDEYDDRRMCFATTDIEQALWWAYARGIRWGGRMLFVYVVEMDTPEVDVNAHPRNSPAPFTSVMSPSGRVVGIHTETSLDDYPNKPYGND
jgi:hypothetical protein